MKLRITGGAARGRVLREPVPEGVRPSSARVREALFSVVGQQLAGSTFLDAYGGTGLMGLEAWSRGATVTVVERNPKVAAQIRRRGAEVGANWTVRTGDVLSLNLGSFDGVYADPPYKLDPEPIATRLVELAEVWLAIETERSATLPDTLGGKVLDRRRRYGTTALWVYR